MGVFSDMGSNAYDLRISDHISEHISDHSYFERFEREDVREMKIADMHDARESKPKQGVDVMLWLSDGSRHEGRWLEHANKYQRNTRKWKVYKFDKYIAEDEVIAWCEI